MPDIELDEGLSRIADDVDGIAARIDADRAKITRASLTVHWLILAMVVIVGVVAVVKIWRAKRGADV